jgi:sec-independent protein translocase protein TatA
MNLAFIQNIGFPELIIIFVIVLILFGAKRLPELFGSFGKSIKEFKKATRDIENDISSSVNEEPRKVNTPQQSVPNPESTQSTSKTPASSE